MSTLANAILIAARAHDGQVDKLGAPYIAHPVTVMSRLGTEPERIVGVLHDVVEDTDKTLDDLRAAGFDELVVAAVDAVTKRKGESLEQSMGRVVDEPTGIAVRVKRADISHNADPARQSQLDEVTRARLVKKYRRSAELLGTTLEEIFAEFGVAVAVDSFTSERS